MLFDLKALNSALDELEQERGIKKEKVLEAIEHAFAAAYKKEYGKRGQIIKAKFNPETGDVEFTQIKLVVDKDEVYYPEQDLSDEEKEGKMRFNPEQHIELEVARRIKSDVQPGDEIEFPLEGKEGFSRIAAQTAKQVIMQKIRAAEREASINEFGEKVGTIVTGQVQRFERGDIYVDLGKAIAVLPRKEQIPGERYRQGERVRALLYAIDEGARNAFLKLSRTRDEFLVELFKLEAPELTEGTVEIKAVVREPGKRSKVAAASYDERIDPIGTLVGARGVRVSTIMSELGGEKIDVIEYSDDPEEFVANALSPAEVLSVKVDEENKVADVEVAEDQQTLAIGRHGQNVRLAALLTGYRININSAQGDSLASSDGTEVELAEGKEDSGETYADTGEQVDKGCAGSKEPESAEGSEANKE